MKAVIIGGGRIGCGSVGHLLAQAGHDVTVVNRDARLTERINRDRGYVVRVAENGDVAEHRVEGVRALTVADRGAVTAAIASADLVATAVGAPNLAAVAPMLAAGLAGRRRPVNVVAFENALDAGARLRRHVTGPRTAARPGRCGDLGRHGFAGGLALRIVAERTVPDDPAAPLTFLADREHRLVVDTHALVASLPAADGLIGTDAYPAWVTGKLHTLNAAHAAAAYLGYLKGYRYVHSAVRDPQIRSEVAAVARLGRASLAGAADAATAALEPSTILRRFENAALHDTVERVARDPLRKLDPRERLTGAALRASEAGLDPGPLALVIAAAIRYARDRSDASVHSGHIVREVCGLDPSAGPGRLVLHHASRIAVVPEGALAVDLRRMSWAWRTERPPRLRVA